MSSGRVKCRAFSGKSLVFGIVMSYGNHALEGLETAAAFVVGYGEGGFYGNQLVYADAFIRLLRGEIEATGVLPVKLR